MTCSWSFLPPDILVAIFKLLSDEDLCHSACTCRTWNDVSKTPCLWRKRTFVFRGYCRSYTDRIKSIKECVQSVGCHIRELKLSCPSPNLLTAYNVTKCVRILFTEMLTFQHSRSTLQSFVLNDLDFDEAWNGFRSSRSQLVSSLTFFLAYQQKLKSIDMSNAFITSPFAFRMMEALSWSRSSRTLERVHLENFFSPTVSPIRLVQAVRTLFRSFSRLKRISLNQCYMVDQSFLILCTRLRKSLQQVDLHISSKNSGSIEMNAISPKVWKEVLIVCPDLKVTLNFDFWSSNITYYLMDDMPLVELNIRGYLCGTCRTSYASNINRLFGNLSQKYQETLSKLSLLLKFGNIPYSPAVHNDDLLSFWASCRNLQMANFSQELIIPCNSPRRRGTSKLLDSNAREVLKLDDSRCIKMKTVSSSRSEEYYSFYVTSSE